MVDGTDLGVVKYKAILGSFGTESLRGHDEKEN